MRKVALFGGTFDPFHMGHLNLALKAIQECNLDNLILLPNYISPFKKGKNVTPGPVRCEMIKQILHYDPALKVSTYEIDREGPSYTYNTLSHFKELYGNNPSFIIGFDSVLTIDTWYHGTDIIREYPLITGVRPDTDTLDGFRKIEEYRELYDANITVLDIEPFKASSSQIRDDIRAGIDVKKLLPAEIEEYIIENGLYL